MSNSTHFGGIAVWYLDARERDRFEATVRDGCADVETMLASKGYVLRFSIDVDHYEPRRVELVFDDDKVTVFADGPHESKHRYANGALCMWHPDDPEDRRWIHRYGAACLLEMIRRHLFLEAYWRETDHWVGDEAPHELPRVGRTTPR